MSDTGNIDKLYLIHEIEKRFHPQTWKIDDIEIWPLIRVSLGANLVKGVESPIKYKKRNQSFHNSEFQSADILFLTNDVLKRKINNKWFDSLITPIAIEAKKHNLRTLSLEYLNSNNGFFREVPEFDYYFLENFNDDVIDKVSIENLKWDTFEDFLLFIEQNLPDIQKPSIEKTVAKYLKIKEISKKFENILERCNPKIIMMVPSYNEYGFALTLAAKRKSIPCVDIQHGFFSTEHFAYSKWINIPKNGYKLLPDYYWSWNEESKDIIENWGVSAHKSLIGGHPLYNYLTLNHQNEDKEYTILYSIQPKPYFNKEEIIKLIKNSSSNYRWIIKLHPTMNLDKKELENYFGDKVIVECGNTNLLELLTVVDLHVTKHSSTAIEAASVGVATIFLDKNAIHMFKELIDSNWAIYKEDYESFESARQSLRKLSQKTNKSLIQKKSIYIMLKEFNLL